MPYELQVAIRYLVARRRQAFISLISFVSALGVAVGVTALVVALALMTGLQGELRDRMLGSMPHIYVARIAESGIADPAAERTRLHGAAARRRRGAGRDRAGAGPGRRAIGVRHPEGRRSGHRGDASPSCRRG